MKKVKEMILIGLIIIVALTGFAKWAKNPELTEMQMFTKYWYLWVTQVVLLGAYYFVNKEEL